MVIPILQMRKLRFTVNEGLVWPDTSLGLEPKSCAFPFSFFLL